VPREVPLSGGRLTPGVVRAGDTVRRPIGARSPFVHALLRHLEAAGFDGAPRLVGVDDRGREVLTFLSGRVPPNLERFDDAALTAAGRLLRRFHDATAGSDLAGAHAVVCHNDPSPCNAVFAADGRPVALIDFDHAAPGDPLRDVAYAGWLWTLSADGDAPPLPEQARQLRALTEGYGLAAQARAGLVDAILRRQAENLAATEARDTPYAREAAAWQERQIAWLRAHAAALRERLLA
jgi:Ser/Thr protein kinase RdoA (MazF antagonist)